MLTANDLINQTRAKEAGAHDGARDFPAPDALPNSSETEQDIQSLIGEELAGETEAFARKTAQLRSQVVTTRSTIPADIATRCGAVRASMKAIVLQHANDIRDAADNVETRSKDLRQFRLLNDRNYEADYNDSVVNLIGTSCLLVALESAGNAWFFGQASDTGLVGGFFTAAMISLFNVAGGFFVGAILLRQFHHVKKWRLILAAPVLAFMLPAAVMFNMLVGHYRERLMKDADSNMIDVVPVFLQNPLNVKTLDSILLIAFGLGIFFFAMIKGWTVWDKYPGYMSKDRAKRQAEEELKEICDGVHEEVEEKVGAELREFDNIDAVLKAKQKELESVAQALDGERAALNAVYDQLEQAGATAIKLYRAANMQVRNPRRPPPAYFRTEFKLPRPDFDHEARAFAQELKTASELIERAQKEHREAQLQLNKDRSGLVEDIADAVTNAEKGAKTRARTEREEQEAERAAYGGARG
jgi:hypothetical protein